MKKTDIGVVTFYVYIFLVFTDSGPYFGNFIFIIYAVYLLAHILIQFNLFLVMFTEVFVVFFYFLSTSFVRHTWPSMNIHVGIPRRGIAKVVARSRSVVVIEFRPDKQAPINSPEAAFQCRRFDFHVFYTDRVTITVTVSATFSISFGSVLGLVLVLLLRRCGHTGRIERSLPPPHSRARCCCRTLNG